MNSSIIRKRKMISIILILFIVFFNPANTHIEEKQEEKKPVNKSAENNISTGFGCGHGRACHRSRIFRMVDREKF